MGFLGGGPSPGKMREARDVEGLIALLGSKKARVRDQASEALVSLGAEAAPALVAYVVAHGDRPGAPAILDPHYVTRTLAHVLLCEIGKPSIRAATNYLERTNDADEAEAAALQITSLYGSLKIRIPDDVRDLIRVKAKRGDWDLVIRYNDAELDR